MKTFKKAIAFAMSLCIIGTMMVANSVSAEELTATSVAITTENESLYEQILELGIDADEANTIIDTVDPDVIQAVLNYNGTTNATSSLVRSNEATETTTVSYSLKHNTYTDVLGWNTEGYCGSVASTILLMYDKDYNGLNISYSTPKALYQKLIPYIEQGVSIESSIPASIKNGLYKYLNTECNLNVAIKQVQFNDYDDEYTTERSMALRMITSLSNNEPVLATGYYYNSPRGGHAVVVESIEITSVDGVMTGVNVVVNTGWGGSNARESIDFLKFENPKYASIDSITYLM